MYPQTKCVYEIATSDDALLAMTEGTPLQRHSEGAKRPWESPNHTLSEMWGHPSALRVYFYVPTNKCGYIHSIVGILLYTRSSVLSLIPTISRVYFYIPATTGLRDRREFRDRRDLRDRREVAINRKVVRTITLVSLVPIVPLVSKVPLVPLLSS